jgi:ribosomal protein L35AE/L33A
VKTDLVFHQKKARIDFETCDQKDTQKFLLATNMLYVEGCKTRFIVGEVDETEGTSVGAKIKALLSAVTIEEQLHILKDVSKFLSTVILKLSCTRNERSGIMWLKTEV